MTRLGVLAAIALVATGCTSYPKHVDFATIDADPAWSTGGVDIAFASSREGGGIYVIRSDGTDLQRLVSGAVSDVVWARDGRGLAYVGVRGVYAGGVRVLGAGFRLPAWSPDANHLAVVGRGAVYIVRSDGSGLRRVPGSAGLTEPSWSPDGRRLVCETAKGAVVAMDIRNGDRQLVAAHGYAPAWSPDGRLIAFEVDGDLWVVRPTGGGLRRVAAEAQNPLEGGHPAWSPDSRRIAFEVLHDRGRFLRRAMSLSIVEVATGKIERLTYGGGTDDDPAWRDSVIGKSTF